MTTIPLWSVIAGFVCWLLLRFCTSVEIRAAWHAGRIYDRYLRIVHKGWPWYRTPKEPAKEPQTFKRSGAARIRLWRK